MEWFQLKWFNPSVFRSFEWANSYMLWLLFLIPILFFLKWVFKSQQQNTLALSLSQLKSGFQYITWLRFLIPIFLTFGMICLIVALARPQLEKEENENYAKGIDIALAIDISESMKAQDLQPSRLGAAKAIAKEFLKGRKQDRIALVAFAGETTTLSALTTDYEQLDLLISSLHYDMVQTSGTALGMALASCINKLKEVPSKSKVAVLISDGDNTAGSIDPEIALELAKSFGIRVYTIAIGKPNNEEKVDLKTMQMLANHSKGQFFRATDNKVLGKIFKKIDMLERTKFKNIEDREMVDYYYTYLNWSILFILLSLFLSKTFLGNILVD